MIINHTWAMPSAYTFSIKPIKMLLARYIIDPDDWMDPFANNSTITNNTNDLDITTSAKYHLDAMEFVNLMRPMVGAVFDPPYSTRQISEHYLKAGMKASSLDTSANFYSRVKDSLKDKVRIVISFGWNTNGMGKSRGFEKKEILIVSHGGSHNDTLVTVETKL